MIVAAALTVDPGWAQLPDPDPGPDPTPSLWITPKGGTASGVADGAVRSVYFSVLLVDSPRVDDSASVSKISEPMLVQAFGAVVPLKLSINAFCTGLPGSMNSPVA
jgi:hypothetical protein